MGAGLPTATWLYDTASDALSWSSPIEELLGFAAGTAGFAVRPVESGPAPTTRLVHGPDIPGAGPSSRRRNRSFADSLNHDAGGNQTATLPPPPLPAPPTGPVP